MTAGDAKIDNAKYKAKFGKKAKMLHAVEVEEKIGHAVGGVCPFAVNENISVFLDESLKRFDTVFLPAAAATARLKLTWRSWRNTPEPVNGWMSARIGRRRRVDSGRTGARISRNQDAYKPG